MPGIKTALDYKPHLNTNIGTEDRILYIKNKEMTFKTKVRNIKAMAWNGAHTVSKENLSFYKIT